MAYLISLSLTPSLPFGVNWYFILSYKSDYGSNVLGEHRLVRGSGSRSLYFLRMRSFSRTDFSIPKERKKIFA